MSYQGMNERERALAQRAAQKLLAAQPPPACEPEPQLERDLPKGVYRHGNRFRSQFRRKGKDVVLGSFETVEAAEIAAKRFIKTESSML